MKKYIKSTYTNAYFGGNNWEEVEHDVYIDGEYQKFDAYYRDLNADYRVSIIPFYNAKSEFFGYKVMLEYKGVNTPPKKTEVFETFYDAMDYVDSGEMAEMYGLNE